MNDRDTFAFWLIANQNVTLFIVPKEAIQYKVQLPVVYIQFHSLMMQKIEPMYVTISSTKYAYFIF